MSFWLPLRHSAGALSLLAASVALVGCAGAVKVGHTPEGDYRVICKRGMKDCISRASKTCGDKGYMIVGGFEDVRVLGGDGSSYRQESYRGELDFYCGERRAGRMAHALKFPTRKDKEPVYELGADGAAAPASGQACVPGATQTCVGPGACAGGQVCIPDGSAFGVCDCGLDALPVIKAPETPAPVESKGGEKAAPPAAETSTTGAGAAPAKESAPAVPGAAPEAEPLKK